MAKIKKFGTFSGVFTPSILTILGVIMYLRFPSIIGQAGLINTIGIIVIAHIISITTSLSVASLSTDKTIKTGGTYFMISRSLGLPIGGTLGLALFVGLSFSVSLYLIGFAESFLAYWNFETSIDNVRITGTIILILVTTITFISTSLAIKSQYFIMAAIVLSLISIFLGHHEFAPKEIHLKPLADAAPFMILFGIFFPAVTGFEAGVSMSGDLKNPKKSLPVGAIAAVAVGFVVYIGLAFFYAFTVDAEALRNDSQILFKISLVPALVIIGIWGATLSSALGSILGAPRILQAIAMDKIVPKFFAKGTGKTNEPRNALLLAFVIAECGILIGELDVIARIVSMFFITTYAFLNLASAIESWSSSDFRPAFKIPKFVSILGAVSAFIVMILLDFIALTGAVVVLGILYFYLTRRELVLETGDAWSSFWTNLAKRSLLKLTAQKTENRNWRPNIILFSGGQQARPHLVELGLVMSGKLGALTDFELVLNSNPYVQTNVYRLKQKGETKNHFSRQFVSDSVENGIKNVTNVYGFSGFEPNTIMMGWSRETKNAEFLADVLTHFKKKNLNAVFLDYDKRNGFGKKENIDIWWNGKGRNLSFALNLMRFILADAAWRDARIRILVINNDNTLTDKLYKNTVTILEEKRIVAEVKIISDDFGNRSKEIIINGESSNADLIVLGISQKPSSYTGNYIKSISHISDLPASILILSPSEDFEEINIISPALKRSSVEVSEQVAKQLKLLPVFENKIVKSRIEKLDEDMLAFTESFIENTIKEAVLTQITFVKTAKEYVEINIKNLEKAVSIFTDDQLAKTANKIHQAFFAFFTVFFEKQGKSLLVQIKDILAIGTTALHSKTGNYIYESSETVLVTLSDAKSKKERNISLPYQKLIASIINQHLMPEVAKHLLLFENRTARLYTDLKNIILKTNDIYLKRNPENVNFNDELQQGKQDILNDFSNLEEALLNQIEESKLGLFNVVREQLIEVGLSLQSKDKLSQTKKNIKAKYEDVTQNILSFPEEWNANSVLLNNAALLDCRVLTEQKIIGGILQNYIYKVNTEINEKVIDQVNLIVQNIENSLAKTSNETKKISFSEAINISGGFRETYYKIAETMEQLPREMEISEYLYEEGKIENITENYLPVFVEPFKIARHFFDTQLYEPFYRELQNFDLLIKQTTVECREANSLLLFRLANSKSEILDNPLGEKDLTLFLNATKKQVLGEKFRLLEALERLKFKSEEMVKNAVSPLYSHSIVQSEKKISTLVRDQQGRKFGIGISENINKLKEKLNSFIVKLLYSSSGGMIQAKKILNKKADAKTGIRQILDFVEKEMPVSKTLVQIPVFYRTLFSSRSLINDDFWIPVEKEITGFKNALQRHKKGYGGAVLISGAHGAGKTSLSRYCTTHYFKKDRVFYITPPAEGSVNPVDWLSELQRVTGSKGDSYEIFRSLPHESVVVINDLEMWWERTNNGYAVLSEIVDLIRVFGRKTFFVLNCNLYSYQLINKAFPMEENFISVLECSPFDARKIQQLIQQRHKTSGLTYNYRSREEDQVSKIKEATLFNLYFSYSEGVPGVAINAWLANITGVQGQNIFIEKPEIPAIDVLNNINNEWLIIIALFIQHKNINAAKLSRIMGVTSDIAEKEIYNLKNAGILDLYKNDIYTLNRFIEPFLIRVCLEKGII